MNYLQEGYQTQRVFPLAVKTQIIPKFAQNIHGIKKKKKRLVFPSGSVVKNLPANSGDTVRSPIQDDPTCHRATGPTRHNHWAWALEPGTHDYEAHAPWSLFPQGRPLQWETHALQLERSPRSPQLKKSPSSDEDLAQSKVGPHCSMSFHPGHTIGSSRVGGDPLFTARL